MDKAKKNVLIVIGIIIAVIAILAIVISSYINEEEVPNEPNNPNIDEPNESLNDEISKLEDEAVFWGLQKIINDYYNTILMEDTSELLRLLDPLYISMNRINASNVYNFVGTEEGIINYVAKNIYYNPDSLVTYYFISGYLSSNSIMGDEYEFQSNVSFLVIVDDRNNYVIRPIDTSDIENYALNYDIVERSLEIDNSFQTINVTEENKLVTYLSEFINFLIDNPREAYNLLDENTKNNYQSYSDFESNTFSIYESLSSRIFSYAKEEDGDVIIYKIKDNKQNDITIYEYGIMNYQIAY